MKEINNYPPNIEDIRKKFQLRPNVVFTYGDTLYNPAGGYIDAYLTTHEETHTKQQGDDIESWWAKYLEDPKFRFDNELEAYRNQYKHFCRNKKIEWKQEVFLNKIAMDLSSEIYGNVVTFEEAKKLIKI